MDSHVSTEAESIKRPSINILHGSVTALVKRAKPVFAARYKAKSSFAKIFARGPPTRDLDLPLPLWRRSLVTFALITAAFMVITTASPVLHVY